MEFRKYMHVERFGNSEVADINIGTCYIFPKIDGTNASVYMNDRNEICAGSRNRQLTLEKDNAGFYSAIKDDERIRNMLTNYPNIRLYGEWLVPHSLKTYNDDAWGEFYVFDVYERDAYGNESPLQYETYKPMLDYFGIEYIPPIRILENPTLEMLERCLDENDYLIRNGEGVGEGIVIKNYEFVNRYGRQIWAKIVTSEFKARHRKTMGVPVTETITVEQYIVEEFVTIAFVEKEYAKIVTYRDGWKSEYIPQLLNTVYYELLKEETWNFLKRFKNPTIDFRRLRAMTTAKVKEVMPELFTGGKR